MVHIRKQTSLADVKADKPDTIWSSVVGCWWTHRPEDIRNTEPDGSGFPCDPRGGVLVGHPADRFLRIAEFDPDQYGVHGLDAFMAAHNDNCVVSEDDDRNTCLRTWDEYNDALGQVNITIMAIPDNWLPTAANINALPEPLRRYIHDLHTNAYPAGIISENLLVRDQNRQLIEKIRRMKELYREALSS